MDHGGADGLPTRRLAVGERSAVGREVVRVVVHLGPMLKPCSGSRSSSSSTFQTTAQHWVLRDLAMKQWRGRRRKSPLGKGGL